MPCVSTISPRASLAGSAAIATDPANSSLLSIGKSVKAGKAVSTALPTTAFATAGKEFEVAYYGLGVNFHATTVTSFSSSMAMRSICSVSPYCRASTLTWVSPL